MNGVVPLYFVLKCIAPGSAICSCEASHQPRPLCYRSHHCAHEPEATVAASQTAVELFCPPMHGQSLISCQRALPVPNNYQPTHPSTLLKPHLPVTPPAPILPKANYQQQLSPAGANTLSWTACRSRWRWWPCSCGMCSAPLLLLIRPRQQHRRQLKRTWHTHRWAPREAVAWSGGCIKGSCISGGTE